MLNSLRQMNVFIEKQKSFSKQDEDSSEKIRQQPFILWERLSTSLVFAVLSSQPTISPFFNTSPFFTKSLISLPLCIAMISLGVLSAVRVPRASITSGYRINHVPPTIKSKIPKKNISAHFSIKPGLRLIISCSESERE